MGDMFYGWMALVLITLLEGFSGFGRTASLSPFLKDLCRDLCLTSAQISGAYMLANLFAGCLLPKIGRWYDQKASQLFLGTFTLIFGISFVGLSLLKEIHGSIGCNFLIFLFCFIGIRTAVNAYTLTGRSMIAAWFSENRGFATGISCFLLSVIASAMPWLNYRLHQYFCWHHIWLIIGLFWMFFMPLICLGIKKPKDFTSTTQSTPKAAFPQNPVFWLIMVALFFKAFQNTSLAFHLIPICEELGARTEQVTLCLITTPITTCLTTFIVGNFFEKIGPRRTLLWFLFMDVLLLGLFKCVATLQAIYGFALVAGIYWGLRQIVAYMVIPKLFGIRSIGTINGWASSSLCMGSSIGPFAFSLVKTYTSYQMALTFCFIFSCILFIIGLSMRRKITNP